MAAKPVLSGFGLVRGSIGLIVLRLIGGIVMILPAMMAASGTATEAAHSEFFASAKLPMPFNHFNSLMGSITGHAFTTLPVMVILALIFKFWLEGGAMRLFALRARESEPVRTWRTIFGEGWNWFWAMLRISIIPAILLTLALIAIAAFYGIYSDQNHLPDDRTAYETFLLMPAYLAFGFALWMWLMGALALHMRAVSVVTERKNTFVAFWRGLGILLRRPGQATLFYILVSAVVAVLSTLVIMQWRAADPRGEALPMWVGLWLGAMVVQAFAWHWLARSAVLLSVAWEDRRAG